MNVIFEGISGAGKTTITNKLCEILSKDNIKFERIGDLEYETPIKKVLLDMVQKSPLMSEKEKFNTSLYESLLLAANHHYVQEKLRNTDKICIYDRDFLSLLAYQKVLLDEEYEDSKEIYEIYKKLVLFDLKKIDYIFYVSSPINTCLERTSKRDNREFEKSEVEILGKISHRFLVELNDYLDKTVILDGEDDLNKNVNKVLRYIKGE